MMLRPYQDLLPPRLPQRVQEFEKPPSRSINATCSMFTNITLVTPFS